MEVIVVIILILIIVMCGSFIFMGGSYHDGWHREVITAMASGRNKTKGA